MEDWNDLMIECEEYFDPVEVLHQLDAEGTQGWLSDLEEETSDLHREG